MSETQTIGELLIQIEAAQARMSAHNPHRRVLERCTAAIVYLSNELHELKQPQTIGLAQVGDIVHVNATYQGFD